MHKFCMTFHAILHGIVVMAADSQSWGPGFEYWHFQIFSVNFSITHSYLNTYIDYYFNLKIFPPTYNNYCCHLVAKNEMGQTKMSEQYKVMETLQPITNSA